MDEWICRQRHKSMDGPRDRSIDRWKEQWINKLTHTDGQDRWIHRWIDRSVGRWIFCIVSFLFYKLPHPPVPGVCLACGQHPHNSVYVIYLSVATQTTFNLFLFPLQMSIDTPTFIHAHADLSCIFSTSIFIPFCPCCVDTSNNKIYCQDLL